MSRAKNKIKYEKLSEKYSKERKLYRFSMCLSYIEEYSPILLENPWLIIHQSQIFYKYMDGLIEILTYIDDYLDSDQLSTIKNILQIAYDTFVNLSNFVQYQPSFIINDYHILKRLSNLIFNHQKKTDTLYIHLLKLLVPTFKQYEVSALDPIIKMNPQLIDSLFIYLPQADEHELANEDELANEEGESEKEEVEPEKKKKESQKKKKKENLKKRRRA